MNSRRRIAMACGVCLIVICIVGALLWWNDQALQTVESQLLKGDAAGALATAEQYLQRHPDYGPAVALRARALVALGRVQEASSLFEQAGAAGPEDLRAWSTALLHLGDWQHALSVLQRLQQVDPLNAETLEAITACQYELGRHQDAIKTASRLASLPGHEATGELQIASIYRAGGHATLANEHFAKVLEYRPDAAHLEMPPAEFFLAYGETLLASGDARRALEMLERASRPPKANSDSDQPELNPIVLLRKADALQAIGKLDDAQQILEQLVQLKFNSRLVREHLAEIALQQDDPKRALSSMQPLLEADEMSVNLAYLLQRTYTALGEESLAEQWQEKTAGLRREEKLLAAFQSDVREQPHSPRARLVTAYQLAAGRDWKAAAQQLAALLHETPEAFEEPFVQQLAQAIRDRGKLPSVDSLPANAWMRPTDPETAPKSR